mmetsp:Transcript_37360/g.89324  ORF Transcript_37360/g.89324 Transcript_37360/m.89324 type:complete len:239 (+) Transcript_37360:158-874(+)
MSDLTWHRLVHELLFQHVKPLIQGDTLAEHVVINFLQHLEEDTHVRTLSRGGQAQPKRDKEGFLLHTSTSLADLLCNLLHHLWILPNVIKVALLLRFQEQPRGLIERAVLYVRLSHLLRHHSLQIKLEHGSQLLDGIFEGANSVSEQLRGLFHEVAGDLFHEALVLQSGSYLLQGLLVAQPPHMMAVHPLELVRVKDGCYLAHALHLEGLEQLLDRVDLLLGPVVPSQLSQIIHQARR